MASNPQHEPTMEEILASIRKIISEDSDGKDAREKREPNADEFEVLELRGEDVLDESATAVGDTSSADGERSSAITMNERPPSSSPLDSIAEERSSDLEGGEGFFSESARKAMYRYSKWPTQALTYQLGKAQILQLRDEVRKLQGSSFNERHFHEAFLSEGTIPPGYFKALLLERAKGSGSR